MNTATTYYRTSVPTNKYTKSDGLKTDILYVGAVESCLRRVLD